MFTSSQNKMKSSNMFINKFFGIYIWLVGRGEEGSKYSTNDTGFMTRSHIVIVCSKRSFSRSEWRRCGCAHLRAFADNFSRGNMQGQIGKEKEWWWFDVYNFNEYNEQRKIKNSFILMIHNQLHEKFAYYLDIMHKFVLWNNCSFCVHFNDHN